MNGAKWQEAFAKTWLSWPRFDSNDHEWCPFLDAAPESSDHLLAQIPYERSADALREGPILEWHMVEQRPPCSHALEWDRLLGQPWNCHD